MVQPKSRFRNLKWVDDTTQKVGSGTFRSVNSNSAYWPNTWCWQIIAAHTETSAQQLRRNWETVPLLRLKFSTWLGLKHLYSLPLAASQPLGYVSWHTPEVLLHEGTFQDKTCGIMTGLRGQDSPDIPMMGSNKWQYCLHTCRLYEVFFGKCESNCIEWLSDWSFSKSTKFSGTPHVWKEWAVQRWIVFYR